MSIDTTQPLPPESLDDQLDSLLRVSASEELAAPQTPPVDAGQTALNTVAAIESQLDGLMAEAAAKQRADDSSHEASAAVDASLAAHAASEVAASSAIPSSVEDLDSQLANLTESLLAETSIAEAEDAAKRSSAAAITAENLAKTQSSPTTPAPSPSTVSPVVPHAATLSAPATAHVPVPHVPASAAHISPAPAPVNAPSPAKPSAASANSATNPAIKAVEATKVKAALQTAAQLGHKATPVGVRVLTLMNRPLEGQSATVRDSLGWLALGTLFNAACVWVFVCFFQKPPDLSVPHDAPHIQSDEPHAKDAASAHGSHDDQAPRAAAGHDEKPDSGDH